MNSIWFDMDGTIADLYKVEGWLDSLRALDWSVYSKCAPRHNYQRINTAIEALIENGWQVGVITWASKAGARILTRLRKSSLIGCVSFSPLLLMVTLLAFPTDIARPILPKKWIVVMKSHIWLTITKKYGRNGVLTLASM